MTADVFVARPVEEVFAYLSDMAKNPEWQNGMESCEWTSEPPIGVGSTYTQQASFMGRPIHTDFEVVEFEDGRRIRIRSTKSTFPLDITRSVESEGEGARVRASIRGEPSGLMGLLAPLTKPMAQRSIRQDYQRLKSLLESS